MERFFNASQMSLAVRIFAQAERMAEDHFRIRSAEWKDHRYDVKTLAYLEEHEVRGEAFAHLCRYQLREERTTPDKGGLHFYRICLQDNRILDAVERAHSFVRLSPLLLYIAAHELVHVIRFGRGEGDFDAGEDERPEEEKAVHHITRNLLKPVADPDLNLVMDCFSHRYQIGDWVQ